MIARFARGSRVLGCRIALLRTLPGTRAPARLRTFTRISCTRISRLRTARQWLRGASRDTPVVFAAEIFAASNLRDAGFFGVMR
jgi:hypothetical protein